MISEQVVGLIEALLCLLAALDSSNGQKILMSHLPFVKDHGIKHNGHSSPKDH